MMRLALDGEKQGGHGQDSVTCANRTLEYMQHGVAACLPAVADTEAGRAHWQEGPTRQLAQADGSIW